ncbi:putative E3 ubiquitin-protein ligase UBR7 [Micropterus salmoides]|uniref:putative E3 ubiquitin-protein ligase UBR7 n=1 Tax=Micropterus salmoides TaxID=27706 RepID=UPI0018EB8DC2|nr:putative E3 ubiquitin-protein ligase UBR7 [Micropterus salmoides]XP_038585751.1 putative E3 ubiquitin-protein ligase UBR7 [Micropterus salmoides]
MAANKDDSDIDDILANEEELEKALCVLAGSDPEKCSYSRGYVKRQAVFACNTCTPSAAERAGICLACANKCHDGHDIFELYTKRNFRCDCGNSKFGEFKCQLTPAKDEGNVRNHYSHNFNGCYCTCDRPYPDTDDQANDEMIQCVICEDWFHSRHLGCTIVEPEELQEMVCEACMNKAPFLWTYAAHFAVPHVVSVSHPEEEVEVCVEEGAENEDASEPSQIRDVEPSTSAEQTKQEEAANRSSPCKRTHEEMRGSPVKATTKTATCRLKELQAQGLERLRQGAVFWPYSWRSELCTCTSCKKAYVAAEVQFLMDQSDTILAYENKGLEEPFGQHPLMALTNSMDRVQQLEVIYGFNELTTSITAFLDQCVAEGKMVTVEAVHQFFEELRARKRRRTNAGYQ